MPRSASRITLEVTDVRVERLQAITEEDAVAEGFESAPCGCVNPTPGYGCTDCMGTGLSESAAFDFRETWEELNKKRAPWDANPWVWAITFRRLETQ